MPSQLYVFDSRVELPEGFFTSLTASDLVLVIDERADGVAVLRDYLAGREPLAAIHLISHGGQGFFTLGCTVLDNTSMASYRLALADIGAALVSDGDLLIYGCNVAQGAQGQAFVQQLAQITQADLAASSDATGAANAGGNGQLEVIVGAVETPTLDVADFSTVLASSQANWLQGTAAGDTLAGLGGQDVLLGAGGGDDLIGGPGDDVLDGGAGEDTAWFLGKRAAYSITPMADGTVRVTGPDGTDSLISVEQLRFTDSAVAVNYSPQAAEYAATGAVNGDQMAPSLAALWTDGAWGTGSVLAWESQNGDDHDVFVQGFLQSGLPMTEPLQVNTNTQTKASQAQVVGLLDGGWLVTWQSWESPASAAIMARRYRADGQALGEEFSVSSQAGINANPQVSVDNRGEWSIVWSNWSAGIASIHARDYSSQGASSAAPRVVATSNDSLLALPAVQRSWFSSDVVVAWTEAKLDGSQVLYATYAGDGSAGQATLLSGDAKLSSTDRLAMVPMRDVSMYRAKVSVHWISDVFSSGDSIASMRLWEDRSADLGLIGVN